MLPLSLYDQHQQMDQTKDKKGDNGVNMACVYYEYGMLCTCFK